MTPNPNTQPISIEEFFDRINNNVYQIKGYYSIYITPKGKILDCCYPQQLGHNELSTIIYENLDALPKQTFDSCLRGLTIPFKEVPYYLEDYHKLFEVQYESQKLYCTIDKVLLGTEDRICQDMGFVKVSINYKLKTFEVVVPNSIFEKNVTAYQKEVIENLSEFFNLDIVSKLKAEQKENARIAALIQQTLNKINISKNSH